MRSDVDAAPARRDGPVEVTTATAVAFALTNLDLTPCEADVLTHSCLALTHAPAPGHSAGPWSPHEVSAAADALADRGLLEHQEHRGLRAVPHLAIAVAASVNDRNRLARASREHDRENLYRAVVARMCDQHTSRIGVVRSTDLEFADVMRGAKVVINAIVDTDGGQTFYDDDECNAVGLAVSREVEGLGTEIDIVATTRLQVPSEASYFAALAALPHCHVHASDGLTMRMALIDDRMAVIPLDPHHHTGGALVTSDAEAVAFVGVQLALQLATSVRYVPDIGPQLRSRELDVLRLLASGHTDASASRRLRISDRSVRRIVVELQRKLGVDSRFELAVAAARRGVLGTPTVCD